MASCLLPAVFDGTVRYGTGQVRDSARHANATNKQVNLEVVTSAVIVMKLIVPTMQSSVKFGKKHVFLVGTINFKQIITKLKLCGPWLAP